MWIDLTSDEEFRYLLADWDVGELPLGFGVTKGGAVVLGFREIRVSLCNPPLQGDETKVVEFLKEKYPEAFL